MGGLRSWQTRLNLRDYVIFNLKYLRPQTKYKKLVKTLCAVNVRIIPANF